MIKTKRGIAVLLAAIMILAMAFTGCNQNTTDNKTSDNEQTSAVLSEPKEGSAEAASALLTAIKGTYEGLFAPVTFQSQYDKLWVDYCAAVVGSENAKDMAAMMKYSIGGSIYGEKAVSAYEKNPESAQFCCEFSEGLDKLTFNGNSIAGKAKDGSVLFSHDYEFVSYEAIGEDRGVKDFNGYLFKSKDDNSDEFTYFIILPDTPETTHHIEFRYGSDIEALKQYASGKYAYWLAAGILTDASQTEIEEAIALFCTENMDYSAARSENSKLVISDFVGTWDADLSTAGDKYADATIYTVIDADGNGTTYMNDKQTNSYMAFAYDNDGDTAKNSGVYVAYDKDAGEAESSKYELTDNGKTLTFFDLAGTKLISYTKR